MFSKAVILNRLNRQDSVTKLDIWYKHSLGMVEWNKSSIANIQGTQVSMGETYTVLVPFSNEYKPYGEWKGLVDKSQNYTLSAGDLIVLVDDVEEDVTPNTIATIKQTYAGRVCEVKSIFEVSNNGIAKYQFKVGGI